MNELEFFHQATLKICSSLNIQATLKNAWAFLRGHIPCDGILVCTYTPGTHALSVLASQVSAGLAAPPETIPLGKQAVQFLQSRQIKPVERHNHPETHVVDRHVWKSMGKQDMSKLVLHLEIEKTKLGVIILMARGFDRFTAEHERMISLLHEPFAIAMANTLKHREVTRLKEMLSEDCQYLTQQLYKISGDEIVGAEFGLKPVMEMVGQVAPLNSHVLLLGETGVGKEVIANAIHYASPRAKGPFIKVNCGAIPETLLDSELFGHEKGAFTGAMERKRGRFERADRGTLFLDEIGELPLEAQVRLLRVIQTKEMERVGGTTPIKLDIRIIVATHRDLQGMVRQGQFREDLWYRLNVFPITIPPLRLRPLDIPALVAHFIKRKAREMKTKTLPVPEPGAMERLMSYDWPGNVRELENLVERALIQNITRFPGTPLKIPSTLLPGPPDARGLESGPDPDILSLDHALETHIRKVLAMTRGKIQGSDGAAALMDIHPSTLRNKMKKLGIPYGRRTAGNSG